MEAQGDQLVVATVDGNITITGTSTGTSNGTFSFSYPGIYMEQTRIATTGSGSIAMTGSGGSNGGGGLYHGMVSSLNSTSGSSIATNTGTLSLIGTGYNGDAGIYSTDNTSSIGGAGEHGAVTLAADSLDLQGMPITTTGNLTLKPHTAGTSVGVGSGTGGLSIDDATLGTFSYGSLTIGSSTAGAMDIHSGVTFADPVLFQTGSGHDITLSGGLASTAAGDSFVLASGGNFINDAGASAIDPGAGRFLIYSADPSLNTLAG